MGAEAWKTADEPLKGGGSTWAVSVGPPPPPDKRLREEKEIQKFLVLAQHKAGPMPPEDRLT